MHILLNLEAPIQSWGDHTTSMTKGKNRGTAPIPTYSAVFGIICSSMGINRDRHPEKFKTLFNAFKYVGAYTKPNTNVMTDYQTIGGGYDALNKYEKQMTAHTKNGTIPVSSGWNKSLPTISKISYRDYITDSKFMVIVDVDDIIANDVIVALKNPVWIPVLGRAACIPSAPIYNTHGTYNELIKLIVSNDKLLIYETDKPNTTYSIVNIYDVPDINVHNKYHKRVLFKSTI